MRRLKEKYDLLADKFDREAAEAQTGSATPSGQASPQSVTHSLSREHADAIGGTRVDDGERTASPLAMPAESQLVHLGSGQQSKALVSHRSTRLAKANQA